jgi:hypothetical protein
MTLPINSAQIRRTYYGSGTPVSPVFYDDISDALPNTDVLDTVLLYGNQFQITGYEWDVSMGKQILTNNNENDPIGDALRADCVAYYKLSNTIDSTGRGNTLTNNNSVPFVAGKVGNAASFDGTSTQCLSVGSNPDVKINIANDIYRCCWIKLKAKDVYQYLVVKEDTSTFFYEFMISYDNNEDRFVATITEFVIASTFGSPTVGQWVFVETYYDASLNKIAIAINNGNFDVTDLIGGLSVNNDALALGDFPAGEAPANADIDEFGLFAPADVSTWLTVDKRAYLYNSGAGRTLYP